MSDHATRLRELSCSSYARTVCDDAANELEWLRAGLDESRDMFHEAQNKIVDMKKEIKRLQRQVDSFAGTIRQQREELAKIGGGDE